MIERKNREAPQGAGGTMTKAVIEISADISKEDAIKTGKEAISDKISGNIVKEIYVPGRIINFVVK